MSNNPLDGNDEVIPFGKGADLRRADRESGISRIGGEWRQPSYLRSYLRAARVLLREAIAADDLDQLGLLIFYLLRHSTELLLKNHLGMLYEVADMRAAHRPVAEQHDAVPSKRARDRLKDSHDLASLTQDLLKATTGLGFGQYFPQSLVILVTELGKYEKSPTWSRYSIPNKVGAAPHMKDEVKIPVVELHRELEQIVKSVEADFTGDAETLGGEVYFEWASLVQAADEDYS